MDLRNNSSHGDPYIGPMSIQDFCVLLCLLVIILLGIPLNLLAITSIIARSVHRQVDIIHTYILNSGLAHIWMILFSLIPYFIEFVKNIVSEEEAAYYLFGRVGCFFLPFLRCYPVYVLSILYTALAIHSCQSAAYSESKQSEWGSRLAVFIAWLAGLLAVMEIFLHYMTTSHQCLEEYSHSILYFARSITWCVANFLCPFLSVFIIFPMAFCHASKAKTVTDKQCIQEDGFPIYRLDSRPQAAFRIADIVFGFIISFIHLCCVTPSVLVLIIQTIDRDQSIYWSPFKLYFECLHYAPSALIPLLYGIVYSARGK